ncbi:hypothetical protein [Ferruginibacter sp.]
MNLKKPLLLFILSIALSAGHAEKIADGYIITLKNDTIKGQIRLERIRDAYYIPFNWGMFILSMNFTAKGGTEKEYSPAEIKGFNFDYKDVHYEFRSLNIDSDELQFFKKESAYCSFCTSRS